MLISAKKGVNRDVKVWGLLGRLKKKSRGPFVYLNGKNAY